MKKLLFILTAGLLSSFTLNAQPLQCIRLNKQVKSVVPQAENATSMKIGYCGEMASAIGVGTNVRLTGIVEFSENTLKKYQGSKLTKLLIGIGAEGGSDAKVFLSRDLDNEPFFSQEVTFVKDEWNTIELTEPFEITGEKIYVGYELTSGNNKKTCFPLGVDNGVGDSYADLVKVEVGRQSQWMHLGELGFGNLCIRGYIEGENLPQHDIWLNSVSGVNYVKPNTPFEVQGVTRNMGAEALTSYDITYQIGDGETKKISITEKSVLSAETDTFVIKDLTIAEEICLPVKVTISNPNGVTDPDETDNNGKINVLSLLNGKGTPRKVLLEHFTTADCTQCPAAHTKLEGILKNNENVLWVAHHAGFTVTKDNFPIEASNSYTWFYNKGGQTYAPAIMFDRTNVREHGAQGYSGAAPGPVFSVGSKLLIEKILDAREKDPAYATIALTKEYNAETHELSVTVSGEALYKDLPGTSVRINVFLTEDGLIAYQAGVGNNYEHNHVIRANITPTWGEPLSFEDGKYSRIYTYTLDEKWDPDQMKIIAFLSNYNPKNVNDCRVHNAEGIAIMADDTGIENNQSTENIKLYAQDGIVYVGGEYKEISVYTPSGTLIKRISNQQSFALENGLYILKITDGEKTNVQKVMVTK